VSDPAKEPGDAVSFERKQAELEAIVERLERGEVELEELTQLWERGETLYRSLAEALAQTQGRIEELTSRLERPADPRH
jgi:exodeoxyribonuclease VII small subunit